MMSWYVIHCWCFSLKCNYRTFYCNSRGYNEWHIGFQLTNERRNQFLKHLSFYQFKVNCTCSVETCLNHFARMNIVSSMPATTATVHLLLLWNYSFAIREFIFRYCCKPCEIVLSLRIYLYCLKITWPSKLKH